MQLELFKLEKDDRFTFLYSFIVDTIIENPYKEIKVKDIQKMASKYKIIDTQVLKMYKKTLEEYFKLHDSWGDDDDDYDGFND